MARITVLGLGSMGSSLANAMLRSGVHLTIWNRSAERATVKSLVDSGASFQPDVANAIAATADAIIICVVDYHAIYNILEDSASRSAIAGKTIINLTNGTPKQAREMDTWLKSHGVTAYFDGAVMVTPSMVHTAHSLLIFSGETQDSFDSISELVSPLGRALYFGSQVDAAATLDLAALAGMYGMFLGTLTGIRLLNRRGMKTLPGTEQVTVPLLGALAPLLAQKAKKIDEQRWIGSGENPLEMQIAAVQNITRACEEEGVDGSALRVMGNLMSSAIGEFGKDADLSAASLFLDLNKKVSE